MATVTDEVAHFRDLLRRTVTDTNSSRTATAANEEHTYSTGTLTYALTNSNAQAITDVTGTVSSESHTFTWLTDYTLSGNSIVFSATGTLPDNGTTVYVDYRYGPKWITLNDRTAISRKPCIRIYQLFTTPYATVGEQDTYDDIRMQLDIHGKSNSDLNTVHEDVKAQILTYSKTLPNSTIELGDTVYIEDGDFTKIAQDVTLRFEG